MLQHHLDRGMAGYAAHKLDWNTDESATKSECEYASSSTSTSASNRQDRNWKGLYGPRGCGALPQLEKCELERTPIQVVTAWAPCPARWYNASDTAVDPSEERETLTLQIGRLYPILQ